VVLTVPRRELKLHESDARNATSIGRLPRAGPGSANGIPPIIFHDLLSSSDLTDTAALAELHNHAVCAEVSMNPGEIMLTRTPFGPLRLPGLCCRY